MLRLLLLVIALIVYGSLYPWHFDFTRGGGNPLYTLLHSHPSELNKFVLRDAAINLLLYLPLGWTAVLVLLRRLSAASALTITIGLALILSAGMEMLQLYIPNRYCNLFDVTANVIGAGAGAVLAVIFRRRKWPAPVRFNAAAIFLLACWIGYQLFPFFPLFSRTRVLIKLQMLIHSIPFSAVDMWANATEWFTVGVVMEALAVPMRSWWLLAAMCCLPLRLLVVERTVTLGEAVGAALALLLLLAIREKSRTRLAAWMLASAIALRELSPYYFAGVPTAFSWIPFASTFDADRPVAVVSLLRKAFEYGGEVWLLRGLSYWGAGLLVAGGLLVFELVQQYLPGRTPEITDSVLALLMAFVLWRLSKSA